jgi:uncharacterized PurR-regulated membrane protein YhhQ (DUF165 family)
VKLVGFVSAALFVATVWAANWAIERYGFVPVGFGLEAPAGVYFAGLAFTLRDVVHRTLGRWAVLAAILTGAGLSYLISPRFATASAVAFLVSEACDFAVYEPLRRKGWLPAVVASNIVGLVVDSALFLWLAFGSLAFIQGQLVGKAWMTLAGVLAIAVLSQTRLRKAPA